MGLPFRSYEHLLRLAAVFLAAAAAFLVVRWLLVPPDYGELGSYRTAAVALNQARAISFAGQAACIDCHTDVADARKENAHAHVSCESCHGAHAAHAADPAVPAVKPDPRTTCAICHTPNAGKPAAFKTVNFREHADEGPCTACHSPHAPRF